LANLPKGLYILPYVFFLFYFFNCRLSNIRTSQANGPIFTKISGTNPYTLFISLSFFDFSRDVAMTTKVEKLMFYPDQFVALPFGNGLQYRNSDFKRFNRMNVSTLCTILVAFGPETSEFMLLTIVHLRRYGKNRNITQNISRISWTYLDLLYRFGRRISGDDFPNINLAVAKGTLLWQPVRYGRCLKSRVERPAMATWLGYCWNG